MPLTTKQKGDLEETAMLALGGNLRKDLVNGVRVMTKTGAQVAAVYWSDVRPGNDVEIALCPSRVSEKYGAELIHSWIDVQKARWTRSCNVHQAGSDWPIFGLSYSESMEFLKALRRLRLGMLTPEEQRTIQSFRQSLSRDDVASSKARAELATLLPNKRNAVYDLVHRAGVSVAPWSWTAAGAPVANPRSNPAYCYNWSFGGTNEPSVACLWHESFSVEDGSIVCRGNIRQLAAELENVASRPGEDAEVKIRARNQAARGRAVDGLIQNASEGNRVLRVIVNEGHMRSEKSLGYDRSAVKVRLLDGTPWRVDQYATQSGDFLLVRGHEATALVPAEQGQGSGPAVSDQPKRYSDQFDAGRDEADRHHLESLVYGRDPAVRAEVLERAEGLCEFCNAPGFVTRGGTIYLESHHVVPLSESGADRVWNVVALCPNDHREAHFSERSPDIRAGLLEFLSARYPSDER